MHLLEDDEVEELDAVRTRSEEVGGEGGDALLTSD